MASRYSSEILAVITALEWDFTPTVTTLRVALYGGMYDDTEDPSGLKQYYRGRIKSDVILDKKIGVVFWNEDSVIDFGFLDVAIEDQNADIIDFAKKVTIASVDIYRVNVNDATADQLSLATSSRSSDIGFMDEDTVRFRLESILQGGFDTPINELYYDSTYPQLEGKPYPIAWGHIGSPHQLLPTVMVDATTLEYHVTDLEISDFVGDVYDRGIVLLETTNFVPVDYGFELQQNPDGDITSGQLELVDPEDTTGELTGLYRFVRLAMTRGDLWSFAEESELTYLETFVNKGNIYPDFFATTVVKLESFMDEVFAGTGSWYYVDEFSSIHFGMLVDPDGYTATLAFTDAEVVGEIKVDDDKAPGLSTRISHAESPGAYEQDELAGDVSNSDRLLMTNTEYVNATTQPVIDFYAKAATRDPIKLNMSYSPSTEVNTSWTADALIPTADSIDYTADGFGATAFLTSAEIALVELDRWWAYLYNVRRRFYTFMVMLNDPLFSDDPLPALGDFVTLQSDLFDLLETPKNLLVRRLKFDFSNNQLTIEGWG